MVVATVTVWRRRSDGRMSDPRPIGVFDSGVGGLTVARAIVDLLPNEPILYLGDNGRFPYGPRPLEEIRAVRARDRGRTSSSAT